MEDRSKKIPDNLEGKAPETNVGSVVSPGDPGIELGTDPLRDDSFYKTPLIKRISKYRNFYLSVFISLLVLVGSLVYAALKWGNETDKTAKSPTLTSDQLSALSGTTAILGDSRQTLDIQSATIFEKQVLMRGDLSVAGSLKLEGSMQLTSDLGINRHITPGGGMPGKSNGPALGSGGTVSVSGSDTAGTVTIQTGSSPPAGCFVTVTFAEKFITTPHIVISASNISAGSFDYYINRTTTNFSLCSVSIPTTSTSYIFDYIVLD